MAKKKRAARKGQQGRAQAKSGLALPGFLRRHARPLVGGSLLAVILAAILLLTNPFGPETALDASGERVNTGPIDTPGASPRTGRPAPNFVLADYDGNAVRLSDFEGKVVFLNFWATWCTACEAEMPDMERLAAKRRAGATLATSKASSSSSTSASRSPALTACRTACRRAYSSTARASSRRRSAAPRPSRPWSRTTATPSRRPRDALTRPQAGASLRAARRSVASVAAAAAARRGRRRR